MRLWFRWCIIAAALTFATCPLPQATLAGTPSITITASGRTANVPLASLAAMRVELDLPVEADGDDIAIFITVEKPKSGPGSASSTQTTPGLAATPAILSAQFAVPGALTSNTQLKDDAAAVFGTAAVVAVRGYEVEFDLSWNGASCNSTKLSPILSVISRATSAVSVNVSNDLTCRF